MNEIWQLRKGLRMYRTGQMKLEMDGTFRKGTYNDYAGNRDADVFIAESASPYCFNSSLPDTAPGSSPDCRSAYPL